MASGFSSKLLNPYIGIGVWIFTLLMMAGCIMVDEMGWDVENGFSSIQYYHGSTPSEVVQSDVSGFNSLDQSQMPEVHNDSSLYNAISTHYSFYTDESEGDIRSANNPTEKLSYARVDAEPISLKMANFIVWRKIPFLLRRAAFVSCSIAGLWCLVFFIKGLRKPLLELTQRLKGGLNPVIPIRYSLPMRNLAFEVERVCSHQGEALRAFNEICHRNDVHTAPILSGENPFAKSILTIHETVQHLAEKQDDLRSYNEAQVQVEDLLKTEHQQEILHTRLLSLIAEQVMAQCGVLYGFEVDENDSGFKYLSRYAIEKPQKDFIPAGQGLLGEVAIRKERIISEKLPTGYMTIKSGLGSTQASSLVIIPLMFKDQLYGALELGFFNPIGDNDLTWLDRIAESIAAHFFNRKMHEDTQRQLEEIARKQEQELVQVRRLQQETYEQLERQFQEVQQEKARSVAVLEGCVDGVISFDHSGKILFSNTALREMLGYSALDLDQKLIGGVFPIELIMTKGVYQVVVAGTQRQITTRTEVATVTATGEPIDVLVTASQFTLQQEVLFNFFVQKISVDLF